MLAPAPELSDLIRDIGVEQVDHPGVVARFVLPELWTVPPDDRHKLLMHVRANWPELKQNQALLDQFKEVRGRRGYRREGAPPFAVLSRLVSSYSGLVVMVLIF